MPSSPEHSAAPATRTRDAGRANSSQEMSTNRNEGGKTNEEDEHVDWQFVKESLNKLQADLGKIAEKEKRLLNALITRVDRAVKHHQGLKGSVKAWLDRIETLLKAPPNHQQATGPRGSWAAVAAKGTRHAGATEPPQPIRHTIRVQLAQAAGLDNESILKELKKTIPNAAEVRVLKSGDIDVTVPDEATKEKAQGLPSTKDLKMFRRDYLIEVPGVALSINVATGKNADDSLLA